MDKNKKKELTVKKTRITTFATALMLFSGVAAADESAMFTGGMNPNAPQNVQSQLCTLNKGKSIAQYEKMFNKYIAWSKANDVELTVVRTMPFIATTLIIASNTQFVEHLVSDHTTSGKSWDLWVSTPEGQKLNPKWQSIAQCDLKMSTLNTQWADVGLQIIRTRVLRCGIGARARGVSLVLEIKARVNRRVLS